MDRNLLIKALEQYRTDEISERSYIWQFLQLLEHPNAFNRDHLPGHITGSAWIINRSGDLTLLTHHAKLDRWLQPGGHADGDENVLRVAMREAKEETGLSNLVLRQSGIFDIDIHTIPGRREFPEHLHYDIRFLMTGDESDQLTITEESHQLAWMPLAKLLAVTQENDSMMRMIKKVQRLF